MIMELLTGLGDQEFLRASVQYDFDCIFAILKRHTSLSRRQAWAIFYPFIINNRFTYFLYERHKVTQPISKRFRSKMNLRYSAVPLLEPSSSDDISDIVDFRMLHRHESYWAMLLF